MHKEPQSMVIKEIQFAVLALFLIAASSGTAAAMRHEATVEKGKALFNDPGLGTNGRSCGECHKNGQGIEKASDRQNIANIVNGCITHMLKGNALKENSVEMQSLIMYIKSLGNKKP